MDYSAYRIYRSKHDEHLWQELLQAIEEFRDFNPDDWRRPLNMAWYVKRVAMSPQDRKAQRDLRAIFDHSGIALNFFCFTYLARFFDDLTLSEFLAWGREDE